MEFTHIANPVRVNALQITDIEGSQGTPVLILEDGGPSFIPTIEMLSRMKPKVGDYLVTQEDGYQYLNPKDVFERKYRVIGAEMTAADKTKDGLPFGGSRSTDDELRATALNYASRHYDDGSDEVVRAAEAYYQFLKGAE